MKKYKLHPIGCAIKWALKDCPCCINNYYTARYQSPIWKQDINSKWHVEIGY